MWLAKYSRRSGSKVDGLDPKREGSHSREISSRSRELLLPFRMVPAEQGEVVDQRFRAYPSLR